MGWWLSQLYQAAITFGTTLAACYTFVKLNQLINAQRKKSEEDAILRVILANYREHSEMRTVLQTILERIGKAGI